jgi:hypothetical protein
VHVGEYHCEVGDHRQVSLAWESHFVVRGDISIFGQRQVNLSEALDGLRKAFNSCLGLNFHPPTFEFGWFSVEEL